MDQKPTDQPKEARSETKPPKMVPRRRRPRYENETVVTLAQLSEGRRAYWILAVISMVLFFTGLQAVPPMDRDEARFMQATAQMLETGDYTDIRFQDTPRHKKPPGIHWLQAVTVPLFSALEARLPGSYRIPSAIGATLAVLFTFALGCRLFDRRTGFLAAGIMASSVLLILEAHQAKTDAFLLGTVAATQYFLARIYMSAREHGPDQLPSKDGLAAAGFWLAIVVGIWIKGPITPLIALLTIITLSVADRDIRWLKGIMPLPGLLLTALLVYPLFTLIGPTGGAADHGAGDGQSFVMRAITTDLIPKLISGQESHGAPPGYFTLLAFVFFWPASMFIWPSLYRAWQGRREQGAAAIRFCLFWVLPAWIFFEAVPTKLPHYVLPAYPAIALITAWAVVRVVDGKDLPFSAKVMIPFVLLWGLVALVLGGAAIYAPIAYGSGLSVTGIVIFAILVAMSIRTFRMVKHGNMGGAAGSALPVGALMVVAVVSFQLPKVDAMWVARDSASALTEAGADTYLASAAGFHEPSLVFLTGTDTVLTNGEGAAQHLLAGPKRTAIVEQRELNSFKQTLGDKISDLRNVGAISGINYSKGKDVTLHLYIRD